MIENSGKFLAAISLIQYMVLSKELVKLVTTGTANGNATE